MGIRIGNWAIACCLLAVTAAPAAHAQATDDTWQYSATLYVWLPGISGRTQFPSGAGGPPVNVNAKDVLDKLDMAFMGTAEARRGRWGGLFDWVYSDLGGNKSGTRDLTVGGVPPDAGVSADLGLQVKTNVMTLLGSYAVVESPTNTTSLVAGTRMLSTDQRLRWTLTGTGSIAGLTKVGVTNADATNWDAILGVRGRARLESDSRWFVPYHLDIGTGASRRTWQAVLGVGYGFDFGDVGLVWRYLDYTFKPSEVLQTLTFNGVALGVTFRW